jgi:hypothetical protein
MNVSSLSPNLTVTFNRKIAVIIKCKLVTITCLITLLSNSDDAYRNFFLILTTLTEASS